MAVAQTAPGPALDPEEGLRRQEDRAREQQRELQLRADDLRAPPSHARRPELPDERPCFVIHEIALLGPDAQRFQWLSASAQTFEGRCIGVQGVSRIAAYLGAQLIEQGYVTSRVGIGPQDLSQGRLAFELQIGRISEVRLIDAETQQLDSRWGTWVNAFPTRRGRRLDARDLEQGVEQMKRLPSQHVTTTLAPGTEPGTSVLTIERGAGELAQRIRGGITLDNSGGSTLGRTQLSANLSLDNALGLNDIAAISVNGNAEHAATDNRSQSANLHYAIPLGYSSFSTGYSRSRFAQNVQLTTTRVLSSGDSETADLKWEHVAWRTSATKTSVQAGLSTRRARGHLDDVELITQRRRTTALETGLNYKLLFDPGASLEVTIARKRGAPWIGAQDDLPAETGLTLRPRLWQVSANAGVAFTPSVIDERAGQRWHYSVSFQGQFTRQATTSIDQISIGSRGTVRGFDGDSVLLAESGWFVRNELTAPLPSTDARLALYAGFDIGRVWGPSDVNLLGNQLAGIALGLRGQWQAIQFDLAISTPVVKPEGFRTGRLNPYVSATHAF